MRNFRTTILLIGTALALQACATGEDVTIHNKGESFDPYADASQMSYDNVARGLSGGSVQVYGLDQAPPPSPFTDAGPGYPVAPAGQDNSISDDPNVQVFSLDAPRGAGMPAMMPPAGQQPGFDSPFGAPQGGDAPVRLRPPSGMDPNMSISDYDINRGGPVQTMRGGMTPPAPMSSMDNAYNNAPPPGYETGVTLSAPGMGQSRVYFAHGSSRLNQSAQQVIGNVAGHQGRGNPTSPIEVIGHASSRAEVADPVERRIINLKMSMDRAYQVSSDLIRQGVPATAIKTSAFGDTRPATALPGVDAEAASRRVEILTAP